MRAGFFIAFALCCQAADMPYQWNLPAGFPRPHVPADNPMTAAKVELGRYLFYDKRLSGNGTQACASCHIQKLAFTDGKGRAIGSTGQIHPRSSMSLVNVAYATRLTWANADLHQLEEQMRTPMFGEHPVELGMEPGGGRFLKVVRADERYKALFQSAYPRDAQPFTLDNIVRAIACFERSIVSARSPYDRYHFGRDDHAVSAEVKHGEELFFSDSFGCFHCHSGATLSGANSGGEFKAATLRNVALTAPYLHDGSLATLDEVLERHATPDGVAKRELSARDRSDLIEFLRSLTDEELTRDPKFANPWD
jgi:cytochrome c peroxidase